LNLNCEVIPAPSVIGGGSTPDQPLPSYVLAIRDGEIAKLERRLRTGDPPVIARIADDALIVDLRTVMPFEEDQLVRALNV
jgi:L-seryl-tRNA(Ser) seleniumtransferase